RLNSRHCLRSNAVPNCYAHAASSREAGCRAPSPHIIRSMWIVHVHVHVKPEHVEEFRLATIENARNSVKEPGIARFDVIQQVDDATRFVLVEVYRNKDATVAHKETAHYH